MWKRGGKRTYKARIKKSGYRSGLEIRISEQLDKAKHQYSYESEKLKYIIPESAHTYTPDFILLKKNGDKMYIEVKGMWPAIERKKMALVKAQHSDIDIRMIFTNPNNRISKKSKTTYGDIANKLNIPFAKEHFPEAWLSEL